MQKEKNIDELAINTIRMLALDMVEKAGSGHPGLPLGDAKIVYILWQYFLKHNPKNPNWINRDRFILSAGHGSALLYALLFLYGYDLKREDILNFRQFGYRTPGHPEYPEVPGVEVTTGPLGQGFAAGVGMGIGQKFLQSKYSDIDYRIYAVCSDGDIMEGISGEAASLAGHLKLGNLIYVYLDNHITIEGDTKLAFSEDVGTRFLAYNWQVIRVEGYDDKQIKEAFFEAQKEIQRPTLIIARTHIGKGVPNKEDTPEVHGSPLTKEEVLSVREGIEWPLDKDYYIPNEVYAHFQTITKKGEQLEEKENKNKIINMVKFPKNWEKQIKTVFSGDSMATRKASGKVINELAKKLPNLFGGSADLAPSCNTYLDDGGDFSFENYSGRNIHFGVREHAMGAILNGLARTPGIIPYGSTFFIFSDYMRPAIRLAALMKLPVIYVFTHDSFLLGEDGPTHQPIEHLASLRAMPNLTVIRPADANEVREAWIAALKNEKGPTVLVLSRQNVPVVDRKKYNSEENLHKGAYLLSKSKNKRADITIYATGSEVHLALEVQQNLLKELKVEVINVPSFELFAKMDKDYQREILNRKTKKMIIEAASSFGWEKFVGGDALYVTKDDFGASGTIDDLQDAFGFTVEKIVKRIKKWA